MRRFESSRPSQAVPPIRDGPQLVAEKPTNGGLLQFGCRSPDSQFGHLRTETPKVSGHLLNNSRFPETPAGDWVRSALGGGPWSGIGQLLRVGNR